MKPSADPKESDLSLQFSPYFCTRNDCLPYPLGHAPNDHVGGRNRNGKDPAEDYEPPEEGGRETQAIPNEPVGRAPAVKGKKYAAAERTEKLTLIQGLLSAGKSTLKDALKKAGITEQTYYNWKKAAEPISQGDDLKDLLKLEEENKRLRKALTEKLRAENAELRRRLVMA